MQTAHWPFLLLLLGAIAVSADELALETDSISKDYAGELPRISPTEPEDTLGNFQIVDGFRIELAANEPLISDPISMAFDERGRLFVVCMRGYSEHRDDKLGVVRLLEDTDDDGVFDRGTDYVKDLAWPTAVACYDGGIFVGAPPNILYCKDNNDDGIADEQKVIFTGFGHQNVQGMLNSFRWGFDNRLYGAAGTNGGKVVKPGDTTAPMSLRGRDFSFEPTTLSLRPESGGAQHGATFGLWGDRFVCSNSDHLQWVEFEDHYLRRNPLLQGYRSRRSIASDGPSAEVYRTSAVEPWRVVRTRLRVKGMVGGPVEGGGRAAGYFTSASGVTAYTGDAFARSYRSADFVFVGDVGSNLVHLKKVTTRWLDKGTSRATAEGTEFLTSTDNWFRPVQFANGPDGLLYVIDMYRETIEHPLSLPPMIKKHLDLNSGRARGRIYRIAPTGWQRTSRPLPADVSDAELVSMLSHSNGWHRETAARLIVTRAETSDSQRDKLAAHLRAACAGASPIGRIRTLYCLQSIGRLSEGVLVKQLGDQAVQVRRHALKVVEAADSVGEATTTKLKTMVTDPNLLVRNQLAFTLGGFDWEIRGEPLAQLAAQASQWKMQYAVLSSMGDQRFEMLQALLGRATSHHSLEIAERIVRQIGRKREALDQTVRLINRQPADVRMRLIDALLLGTGLRGERLIAVLSAQGVENSSDLVTDSVAKAQVQALEVDEPLDFRLKAINRLSLGEYHQSKAVFDQLLLPEQPAGIRDAVVGLFALYDSIDVAKSLTGRITTLSPRGRRQAFDLLISRADWALLLLNSVADETLSATQISTRHRQQLLNHRSSDIASLAKTTLGAETDRTAIVDQLTRVLDSTGDVARGKLVFRRVCASCHRLDDHGADVGPQLQPLRNRGAAFMLVNILDPNREVDARYEAYTVLTDDGRTQSGILISDSASAIELLLADGTKAAFAKDEIEEFQATGKSLMPEGLEGELTEQGIADVIAYLIQNESPSKKDTTP